MSLIKCPECEKEISDKINSCIHCGFPIPKLETSEDDITSEKEEIIKEAEPQKVNNGSNNNSFWSYTAAKVLLVLVILSLCLSAFSILSGTENSDTEERLSNIEETLKFTNQMLQFTRMGVTMTEGVVTDKVVVQKASFYSSGPDAISASIDIRPQPSYTYKFLGQGDFDLTDRELRSMLEEVVNKVLDYGSFDFDMFETVHKLSIENGTIYITANNYDVAEYGGGKITLTGE